MISFKKYNETVCRIIAIHEEYALGFIHGVMKQVGLDYNKLYDERFLDPRMRSINILLNLWESLQSYENDSPEHQKIVMALETICDDFTDDGPSCDCCCCDD